MSGFLRMMRTGDVRSWDDARRRAITPEMRAAVEFFHHALRDDWSGWDLPEKWEGAAPLACNFHTSFQQGPPEWVRLHRLAELLAGLTHLDAVVGRRGVGSPSWTDYYATVMTLEICAGFLQAGRGVELIQEPDDDSPDVRIVPVSRVVTTEFKALHEAEETQRWDMLFKTVMGVLNSRAANRGLDPYSIDIHPTQNAIEQPDAFVEGLIAVLEAQSREPQELPGGTGRARVRDNPERMNWWHPPVREVDDLTRLVGKISGKWYRKVRNLDGPALIMVRTQMLAGADQQHVEATAAEVAQVLHDVLSRAARFSAVLVYEELMWPPPRPAFVQADTHRLALGSSDGRSYRAALLVPNPAARVPLAEDEVDSFVGPRMLW